MVVALAPRRMTDGPRGGELPIRGIRQLALAAPRGFCAGVIRAIEIVEGALARFGAPVYIRRAIVHNPYVVTRLEALGAIVVSEADQVPAGAVVVFSAHGVSRQVRAAAAARGLVTVDATCPLVQKVHDEVQRFVAEGRDVILVGHRGHDEVNGTLGQAPGRIQIVESVAEVERLQIGNPQRVACVTQTTLTPNDVEPVVAALRARFPGLAQPQADDICYATHQRQTATRRLAAEVDMVLVLGDKTSSNSQRLREVAAAGGRRAHLIGSIAEVRPEWLKSATKVGLTAGASTPEWLVQEAVAYFQKHGAALGEGQEPTGEQETVRRRPWESVA